jgi:YegS/Rv2252/BmrU family lipid kinase
MLGRPMDPLPRAGAPGVAAAVRRAVLVVNPTSGSGQGPAVGRELQEGLRRAGVRAALHVCRSRGDGLRHLRSLGSELDLAIAVGGDGTLREVLEGLVDRQTPVGLVPVGTANVLAGVLGLPRDVHHALEILCRGKPRELDTARVDGRLSCLCVGVGFDGWAVHDLEARRRGPIRKWSYAWPLLRALALHRPRQLFVTLDGEPLAEPCASVLVSNAPRYAGRLKLAADARLDDGWLEVYLFPTGRPFELALALGRGLMTSLPGGAVTMRRAKRIRIESAEPVPCQIDGDAGGTTPVEIELCPPRFRILAG